MHTEERSTAWAHPFAVFDLDKAVDSGALDGDEVVDGLGVVFGAVAFIQAFDQDAGEVGAANTISGFGSSQFFTVLDVSIHA